MNTEAAKVTVATLRAKKAAGERCVMVTGTDFSLARIADEVADVLLYLLQVADQCAIDIPGAVANKLVKNAVKHPEPTRG